MKFGKLTAVLAAGTLAVAPIAAQATVADRSAPISGESSIGGEGEAGAILALFALLALAIAIGAGGDDTPVSN